MVAVPRAAENTEYTETGTTLTIKTMVLIFGKDTCPYTNAAREHYAESGIPFDYINVKKNPAHLQRMLEYSHGRRAVPVIVEGEKITIGFGGT
jgi:glutaredoxin 3